MSSFIETLAEKALQWGISVKIFKKHMPHQWSINSEKLCKKKDQSILLLHTNLVRNLRAHLLDWWKMIIIWAFTNIKGKNHTIFFNYKPFNFGLGAIYTAAINNTEKTNLDLSFIIFVQLSINQLWNMICKINTSFQISASFTNLFFLQNFK